MRKITAKILILTFLFSILGLNTRLMTNKSYAQTNTRKIITLSRGYFDYWSYNDPQKAGLYRGGTSEGGVMEVRIGDRPAYTYTHSLYHPLAEGEKVIRKHRDGSLFHSLCFIITIYLFFYKNY